MNIDFRLTGFGRLDFSGKSRSIFGYISLSYCGLPNKQNLSDNTWRNITPFVCVTERLREHTYFCIENLLFCRLHTGIAVERCSIDRVAERGMREEKACWSRNTAFYIGNLATSIRPVNWKHFVKRSTYPNGIPGRTKLVIQLYRRQSIIIDCVNARH